MTEKIDFRGKLVSGGSGRKHEFWDLKTGKCIKKFTHPGPIATYRYFLSNQGEEMLIASGGNSTQYILDSQKVVPVAKLVGHSRGAWGMDYSKKHSLVITGSDDSTVKIFNVGNLCCDGSSPTTISSQGGYNDHRKCVRSILCLDPEPTLVSCSDDGLVIIFDMAKNVISRRFKKAHSAHTTAFDNVRKLVYCSGGTEVACWDLRKSGDQVAFSLTPHKNTRGIILRGGSMNQEELVVGSQVSRNANCLFRYDIRKTKELVHQPIHAHTHMLIRLKNLDDGQFLSCSYDGWVKMWRPKAGTIENVLKMKNEGNVQAMEIIGDFGKQHMLGILGVPMLGSTSSRKDGTKDNDEIDRMTYVLDNMSDEEFSLPGGKDMKFCKIFLPKDQKIEEVKKRFSALKNSMDVLNFHSVKDIIVLKIICGNDIGEDISSMKIGLEEFFCYYLIFECLGMKREQFRVLQYLIWKHNGYNSYDDRYGEFENLCEIFVFTRKILSAGSDVEDFENLTFVKYLLSILKSEEERICNPELFGKTEGFEEIVAKIKKCDSTVLKIDDFGPIFVEKEEKEDSDKKKKKKDEEEKEKEKKRALKHPHMLAELYETRKTSSTLTLTLPDGTRSWQIHKEVAVLSTNFFHRMVAFGGRESVEILEKGKVVIEFLEETVIDAVVHYCYFSVLPEKGFGVRKEKVDEILTAKNELEFYFTILWQLPNLILKRRCRPGQRFPPLQEVIEKKRKMQEKVDWRGNVLYDEKELERVVRIGVSLLGVLRHGDMYQEKLMIGDVLNKLGELVDLWSVRIEDEEKAAKDELPESLARKVLRVGGWMIASNMYLQSRIFVVWEAVGVKREDVKRLVEESRREKELLGTKEEVKELEIVIDELKKKVKVLEKQKEEDQEVIRKLREELQKK